MLLFVILQGVAVCYGAAYLWHSVRRARAFSACGAGLLCACCLAMGILLVLYVV